MPSPLIGITTGSSPTNNGSSEHTLSDKYVQVILRAGGTPVIIPAGQDNGQLDELVNRLDGLMLPGGGDIAPALFNGRLHPTIYGIDENRDALEMKLVRLAAQQGLPFLGICRGAQVINVALGGSLYTDIEAQKPGAERHDYRFEFPRDKIAHVVKIRPGSLLSSLTGGTELSVNSLHHQAIDSMPAHLQPVAHSADGLVEAVELRNHVFGLGVQWHPEWLVESPGNLAIFRGFINAAGKSRK